MAANHPPRLTVREERRGGAVAVVPEGELDLAATRPVRRSLEAAAAQAADVVLDLSGVTFMDSSGLNLLIQEHARERANGARFSVEGARGQVARLLDLSGVGRLLAEGGSRGG